MAPPPSTRIFLHPLLASRSTTPRGSARPSSDPTVSLSTPSIAPAFAPVSLRQPGVWPWNSLWVAGSLPSISITTLNGLVPLTWRTFNCGSSAHDDGVAKRAQAVKMDQALRPGDVMRSAGCGCDIAVEALTELGDHKGRLIGPRQGAIEAKEFAGERIGRPIRHCPGQQLIPHIARALGQLSGKEIAH